MVSSDRKETDSGILRRIKKCSVCALERESRLYSLVQLCCFIIEQVENKGIERKREKERESFETVISLDFHGGRESRD